MSGFDAEATARFLIGQRAHDAVLTERLPDGLRPSTLAEAIAVQMATMSKIGPIGGWKVGAAEPGAEPTAAPLPASGVTDSPVVVNVRLRASECEISFRIGRDLPPRDTSYTRDEVLAAIESCQAAIEVVEPRFVTHEGLDSLTKLADLGIHGGLAVGRPIDRWNPDMFATLSVVMAVDGVKRRELVGSNPGGSDLVGFLVWLANSEAARAAGGLKEGQVVTTGSWTGLTLSPPGTHITARFAGFPLVEVRFGPYFG